MSMKGGEELTRVVGPALLSLEQPCGACALNAPVISGATFVFSTFYWLLYPEWQTTVQQSCSFTVAGYDSFHLWVGTSAFCVQPAGHWVQVIGGWGIGLRLSVAERGKVGGTGKDGGWMRVGGIAEMCDKDECKEKEHCF